MTRYARIRTNRVNEKREKAILLDTRVTTAAERAALKLNETKERVANHNRKVMEKAAARTASHDGSNAKQLESVQVKLTAAEERRLEL